MHKPKITSIANWFGSNRTLGSLVGEELNKSTWVGIPFGGGMSELIYIKSRSILVNDLNKNVINLAKIMAHPTDGPKFYKQIKRKILHPDILSEAQQKCKEFEKTNLYSVDWAVNYFICSWMSRAGSSGTGREFSEKISFRWQANGGSSAVRYNNAVSSFLYWSKSLRRCEFACLDWKDFINKCLNRDFKGNAIYCDPPFPVVGDRYKFNIGENGHKELRDVVESFKNSKVVIRYYDTDYIRSLYSESKWNYIFNDTKDQHRQTKTEVLLTNKL